MHEAALYNESHADGDKAEYYQLPQMISDEQYDEYEQVIGECINQFYDIDIPESVLKHGIMEYFGNKRVYRGLSNVDHVEMMGLEETDDMKRDDFIRMELRMEYVDSQGSAGIQIVSGDIAMSVADAKQAYITRSAK